jgi:hypothetical protein
VSVETLVQVQPVLSESRLSSHYGSAYLVQYLHGEIARAVFSGVEVCGSVDTAGQAMVSALIVHHSVLRKLVECGSS